MVFDIKNEPCQLEGKIMQISPVWHIDIFVVLCSQEMFYCRAQYNIMQNWTHHWKVVCNIQPSLLFEWDVASTERRLVVSFSYTPHSQIAKLSYPVCWKLKLKISNYSSNKNAVVVFGLLLYIQQYNSNNNTHRFAQCMHVYTQVMRAVVAAVSLSLFGPSLSIWCVFLSDRFKPNNKY